MHTRQGKTIEAIAEYERALNAYRTLVTRYPNNNHSRGLSVIPLWRLGVLKAKDGRKDLEEALNILRALAQENRLDAMRRGWIPLIEAEIAKLNK